VVVALVDFLCSGPHLLAEHLGLEHSLWAGLHSAPSSCLSTQLSLHHAGSKHYLGDPVGGQQQDHSPGMTLVPTPVLQSLFLPHQTQIEHPENFPQFPSVRSLKALLLGQGQALQSSAYH
jgi:hypothetical protein